MSGINYDGYLVMIDKMPKITVCDSAWILTQKDGGGNGTSKKERLACEYSDVTVDSLSDLI